MIRKQKPCDICHETITQLGGVAITMKTGPVGGTEIYNVDHPITDFIVLCQKNHHADDEFIAARYLPPGWVRSLLDVEETRCS